MVACDRDKDQQAWWVGRDVWIFILIKTQVSERLQQSRGDVWLVLSNSYSGCSMENWLQNHRGQEYIEKPGRQCRHGALVWASVFPFEFWIFFFTSAADSEVLLWGVRVWSTNVRWDRHTNQHHRTEDRGLQKQRMEGYDLFRRLSRATIRQGACLAPKELFQSS